eukprot:gene10136-biopygen1738
MRKITSARSEQKNETPSKGRRTVARASRGHGAGVARAIGHWLAWVARAWRGHGAGVARACPVTPGISLSGFLPLCTEKMTLST